MTADHPCKNPRSCLSTSVFAALLACLSALPIRADAAEPLRFSALPKDQQVLLDDVERRTFDFFRDSQNTANGLVPDGWPQQAGSDFFSSIASIGFGLTAYGIGAERGWMKRSEAAKRTLTILRFFRDSAQGESGDVTGAHGFYYHFLDMQSGRRFEDVELSSIDSTMLFYGMLFAQSYYDRNDEDEKEIRRIADELYRRADWQWFAPRAPLVSMGWTPKDGFIRDDWHGFTEAAMLYVLALGSPTHALDPDGWKQWAETYPHNWEVVQGQEHLAGGPMFWHQYSQTWIDFRGIQDDYMRKRGIDYFVNSQRAALAQRQYAIHNPLRWKDYGATIWGLTACNGPRGKTLPGEPDRYWNDPMPFYGYAARGFANSNYLVDDGTIAPTAAIASIAFAPEIVIPTIAEMSRRYGDAVYTRYGFVDAFNPSFNYTDRPLRTGRVVPNVGWVDTFYLGIDQGPIVAMLENYRSDFVWMVMRKNPYVQAGLKRAGFRGGWLDATPAK